MNDAEALRESRARTLGYSPEPFYRGEASGASPDVYESAFFSRDEEYAKGFANRGGMPQPREFRLNLSNTFSDHGNITAGRYGALIESSLQHGEQKLAENLAEAIAPGRGVKWLLGFAKAQPDYIVASNGGGALIRQAIEQGSANPTQIFRSSGYDAIDSGRDVRKLTGEGIRLKNAEFNPARAAGRNINWGWLAPFAAGGLAYDAATSDAEAAGATSNEARKQGLLAGGVAAGTTGAVQYGLSKLPGVSRFLAPAAPAINAISDYGQEDTTPLTRGLGTTEADIWNVYDRYRERQSGRNPAIPR